MPSTNPLPEIPVQTLPNAQAMPGVPPALANALSVQGNNLSPEQIVQIGGGDTNTLSGIPDAVMDQYRQIALAGNFKRQNDLSDRNKQNRDANIGIFSSLRSQYPGLMQLDDELMIDPRYRR